MYLLTRKIYRLLCRKFKIFRDIDKHLIEINNTILLLGYTKEWLSKSEFRFIKVDGILYPTIDTIRALHDFLVIKYEKQRDKIYIGELSLAQLDFTGIKYWMEKNPDPVEDIIIRGAHIFNKFLEEGHPFIDGNKRTGWATLWIFLSVNGITFFFPNNFYKNENVKNVEKIKQWANHKDDSKNIPEIIEWIKKYKKNKKF